MVVTLLMNMFFGSRMKGMPPKLVSDDGRHTVIRPLAFVAETDLEKWAVHRQFPIIPCSLCGSQDQLQRVQIKAMIRDWERQYPGRIDNMFTAMGNITLSHMMDRKLFPFTSIRPTGQADPQGDKAFDEDDDCGTPAAPVVRLRLDE
jgi:tRNA 2-thiocytidine biosynthesis protein TtcA